MRVRRIPSEESIVRLSTLVREYPVSRSDVVRIARLWNMPDELIDLLRQLTPEYMFTSRIDLVGKCRQKARLIRREWELPPQIKISF